MNHSRALNKLSRSILPELTISPGIVASRGPIIVADVLVIAATWKELFLRAPSRKARVIRRHMTLTDVFLRDGTYPISFGM